MQVNELLNDDYLYKGYTDIIEKDTDNTKVAFLLENLKIFQLIKKKTYGSIGAILDSTQQVNDYNEEAFEEESDVEEEMELNNDDMSLIQEFKTLNPPDNNPKMTKEFVEETRKHIWDTSKKLDMSTGTCGIAGGVDGSLNHTATINLVSNIYEKERGIAIDFGSGNGHTAQLIAAVTNFKVIGVEVRKLHSTTTHLVSCLTYSVFNLV